MPLGSNTIMAHWDCEQDKERCTHTERPNWHPDYEDMQKCRGEWQPKPKPTEKELRERFLRQRT